MLYHVICYKYLNYQFASQNLSKHNLNLPYTQGSNSGSPSYYIHKMKDHKGASQNT